MVRILGVVVLTSVLSACAQMPQWSWSKGFSNLDFAPRAQAFNFDWQLSGDPQIAPVQVFDDGRRTWLQFAVDQVPPALFQRTERGDVLLKASRDGAYLVLDGVWRHVLVRGGHLVAHVRRVVPAAQRDSASSALAAPGAAQAVPVAESQSEPEAPSRVEPQRVPPAASRILQQPVPSMPPVTVAQVLDPAPDAIQPLATGLPDFAVSPEDGNLRLALVRWASLAGWMFGPEHWAVDVDIPLAGSAAFGAEFKAAVRHLLAATQLGDRPLQPCFYANKVLRVVPFAQRCDRSSAPGAV